MVTSAMELTLILFAAGVIFYAGVLSHRVTSLEQWREMTGAELRRIAEAIHSVEQLIRDGHR